VSIGPKAISVRCGYSYTLVLDEHGSLWGCGSNKDNQMGDQRQNVKTVLRNSKDIQLQNSYSRFDHRHWSAVVPGPVQVHSPIPSFKENHDSVLDMDCGIHHSIVLSKLGEVWGVGQNSFGQAGVKDFYGDSQLTSGAVALAHNSQEKALGMRDPVNAVLHPEKIYLQNKVNKISCGIRHTLFLCSDGEV